jgi:hypothetical protein
VTSLGRRGGAFIVEFYKSELFRTQVSLSSEQSTLANETNNNITFWCIWKVKNETIMSFQNSPIHLPEMEFMKT